MKTKRILTAALASALCIAAPAIPAFAADWVNLLDGNMSHWTTLGDANWSQKDGVTQADGGKGFLVSKDTYTDFHLKLEFYSGTDTNSGIFMRCQDPAVIKDKTCYEANIFDKRKDQSGRTGGIPNYGPPMMVIDTENQWNTYEIMLKGSHITVKLNGKLTVDVDDKTLASGPMALQYTKGVIKFRNVMIKKM